MAAIIGSILILPVLRTRGHYAALVTIAFGILFKTFIEVNDALGGPQGMSVGSFTLAGWKFNDPVKIGSFEASFYLAIIQHEARGRNLHGCTSGALIDQEDGPRIGEMTNGGIQLHRTIALALRNREEPGLGTG